MGQGLLIHEGSNNTQRRTTVGRTPLDEWSARRTDLYLTTHNKHPCPGRIRTHDFSRRTAADLSLRPRGHWDRLFDKLFLKYLLSPFSIIPQILHVLQTLIYNLRVVNPLNAELNPICYLLALLGPHHFLHVGRIRVTSLTLRLLMSYIYIYIYIYIWH